MKQLFFLFILAFIFVSCTPMAHAEKFYFYKEEGKTLPRGQEYDSVRIIVSERGLPGGFQFRFDLPKQYWRGNKEEIDLSFGAGVNQTVDDPSTYLFFIEDLGIRDGEGKVYLLGPTSAPKNVIALDSAEYKKLSPQVQRREKMLGAVQSISGRIRSNYEVDVYKGESFNKQLKFNASDLPKHLFIDYTFRIRKDGEETPHILNHTSRSIQAEEINLLRAFRSNPKKGDKHLGFAWMTTERASPLFCCDSPPPKHKFPVIRRPAKRRGRPSDNGHL
jgi:hypothetical protein